MLAALGMATISFSALIHPGPRLVWNASASVPIGLYWVADGAVVRGDLVLVHTPDSVRQLAAERGYLPDRVPLVKRVAAMKGDRICGEDGMVSINGRLVAARLPTDSRGRPLPRWTGCRVLADGELFLMMEGVPDSFDSRYFGPTHTTATIGRLVPLWTE